MRLIFRSEARTEKQPPPFGWLILATGLVFSLQNPAAVDSASRLLSTLDIPSPAQVFEWRPDGPPPWVDGDQMLTEEVEDLPAEISLTRDNERALDPRERPLRQP